MAIIHRATLTPSKPELIREWLPSRPWIEVPDGASVESVGAFRFDDPDGQVGVEVHLVDMVAPDGGHTLVQVPLSYRNEELPGGDHGFIGTLEHSALGTRWVYDATVDPVFVEELLRTIIEQDTSVAEFIEGEDGPIERERTTHAWGVLAGPMGGENGNGGIVGSGRTPAYGGEVHANIADVYTPETENGITRITVGTSTLALTRFPLVDLPIDTVPLPQDHPSGSRTAEATSPEAFGSLLGTWPGQRDGVVLAALLG